MKAMWFSRGICWEATWLEFKWDKSFDGDLYEMEGAFKVFSEAFK